ncbi:MAG: ATP phosphoribosyltransferase, partial [Lysobacterales bacterium]
STAALYSPVLDLTPEKSQLLERLLARLDGVLQAAESKYVMLNAPRSAIEEITRLLPGAERPSVMDLEGTPERVALHAVCRETLFWEHLEALKAAGASAILVLPVEKMLA